MASLKYWLWLHNRTNIALKKVHVLLERFNDPENIHRLSRAELEETGELNAVAINSLCDKSFDLADKTIEYCAKNDISIISLRDSVYPERLRRIPDPPIVLFVRGHLPDFDDTLTVSFVGTRKCSAYGISTTYKIAGEIAAAGGLIVSGMALGIDAAAHEAALRQGEKTVAVFGCGVDVCYPRQHKKLMQKIIENGAVISEFLPGTPPDKAHFPMRNRIISGLSLGVVIAEAPERSGALITASLAANQGRDVFAIPGDITNPCSHGTNRLIADGAKLVMSGEDVICEYRNQYAVKIRTLDPFEKKAREQAKKYSEDVALEALVSNYQPNEQRVLRAIGRETRHIDEIVLDSGLSIPQVLSMLTIFEISGVVEQSSGKNFKLVMKD